jgi:hypothetical protein
MAIGYSKNKFTAEGAEDRGGFKTKAFFQIPLLL